MPPSGMVTTSIKLCAMVAVVIRRSPSVPPKCCSTAFIAMTMTLSSAMIRNGVSPMTITLPIVRSRQPPKDSRTGTYRPSRNRSTNAQLAACERTDANAAPRTPISSPKINSGSSRMLATAPSITESMPILA